MNGITPLVLGILLFVAGLLFLWQAAKRRRAAGLPGGQVVYSDTRSWGPVEKPFYDAELGLTGKPDYLVEKGDKLIPVEIKTGRIPQAPYDSHIFQLATYCLLIDRQLGKRPPYGIIHYTDQANHTRTFSIEYTLGLEQALLDLLAEIRTQGRRKEVHRSHEQTARCTRCGFRYMCTERLES